MHHQSHLALYSYVTSSCVATIYVFIWMKLFGGIMVSLCPSVCPSICRPSHIRPASYVCSVPLTVLVGSISYLYILPSNFRRSVTFKVSCKISKFTFLAICLNFLLWLHLVLTWDLMWITSMGNHGVAGGISEWWCSSCSSSVFLYHFLLGNKQATPIFM